MEKTAFEEVMEIMEKQGMNEVEICSLLARLFEEEAETYIEAMKSVENC